MTPVARTGNYRILVHSAHRQYTKHGCSSDNLTCGSFIFAIHTFFEQDIMITGQIHVVT